MIREVNMLIPASVAQTAQAAEHGGILLAICQLQAEADIFTDCLGAQRAYSQDLMRAAEAKKKHGATVLAAGADPQKRGRIRSLQWVKAHRDVGDAADAREAWIIRGNAIADEAAKRAAASHPQPSPEAKAELEFYVRRFPHVARAVGAALALFPPAQGNLARRPATRRMRGSEDAMFGTRTGRGGAAKPAGAGAAGGQCQRNVAAKGAQATTTQWRQGSTPTRGTGCGRCRGAPLFSSA